MTATYGPVIDDNNYSGFIDGGARGFEGMFLSTSGAAGTFEDMGIPLIPESEWDDHIRELERDDSTLVDICRDCRLPCKAQSRTNYCWINATAFCAEVERLKSTGNIYNYSPASVGAPIKRFRNLGGWGSEGLEYMRTHGINLAEDWPVNAIDRRYYTDDNQRAKKKHRVLKYYILRSWQERVSCILAGYATSDGYDWWRHQVAGMHITIGAHDLVIRNSWGMGWGDDGFGTLSGRRKYASGSVAITSMVPA